MNDFQLYDTLYRATKKELGNFPLYGTIVRRHDPIIEFIKKEIKLPSSILDASCGRGNLMRKLNEAGYGVTGTELSKYLINNDLKGMPVYLLDYYGLKTLGYRRFEVVVSCDVLEHLPLEELDTGITNLCFVSRKYVLLSVGMGNVKKYPKLLKLDIKNLHRIKKKAAWWRGVFEKSLKIQKDFELEGSYYAFCVLK